MNFVQDFVSGILTGGASLGMVFGALYILGRLDADLKVEISEGGYRRLTVLGICVAEYVLYRQQGDMQKGITGFVMLIYLLLCSVTDYYNNQVYDLLQLGVCVIVAGIALTRQVQPSIGWELVLFALIQVLLFGRMYGEADVMCFLICALSLIEKGMFIWVCHMALSFFLLGIVQGWKRNIAANGNLKKEVPFFPYFGPVLNFL